MNSAPIFISISDSPVSDGSGDLLGNDQYAKVLARFIEKTDTPMTIGIQGGWGSGKTSLLNMLTKTIERAVIVNVNAWEFSLFQQREAVALGLLNGLVTALADALESAQRDNKITKATYEIALGLPSAMEKFKGIAWTFTKGIANVGLNVALAGAAGAMSGGHVGTHVGGHLSELDEHGSHPGTVSALREALKSAVQHTIDDSLRLYDRVVFVIDDLDRVEPAVAVEILDVMKNVVEVSGCVFVLAIDYDVVVKGLRAKFGDRTDETEREFRQYFDKIIQVPFTMPVGNGTSKLVQSSMVSLGLDLPSEDIEKLSDFAVRLTDRTPRSIKRVINTMSLLRLLHPSAMKGAGIVASARREEDVLLFLLVCIQINYPRLYQRILARPRYWEWTQDDCRNWCDIELDANAVDWQHTFRAVCASDFWTKRHAEDLIEILQQLYDAHGDSLGDRLNGVLTVTRVTAVGGDSSETQSPWSGFWQEFLSALRGSGNSTLFPDSKGSTSQWLTYRLKIRDVALEVYATNKDVRARMAFVSRDKDIYDRLAMRKQEFSRSTGRAWDWDWKEGRQTNFISISLPTGNTHTEDALEREKYVSFLITEAAVLYDTLCEPLREEAKRLEG